MEFNADNIPADSEQLDLIEELLKTSIASPEQNENWSKILNSLNWDDANKLIELLQTKQVNRVLAGLNYNQGYVNWFLRTSI